eukprot:Seg97.14 transcript_id=Seg97.14/GoldUCD/mRNA.D3Y31 product="FGFR1 oncogene partner" protein_id=Seg97.14/GoldUCD/D3Y31
MSVEEDTELRDLVAQALETNGVLNKIRAELRASVFLALEEQDSLKVNSNMVNHKLKKFLSTKEGVLVASLVQDFLNCFHLDFTMAVFGPELSHGGKFDSRDELMRSLGLTSEAKDNPLLLELLPKSQADKGQAKLNTRSKVDDNSQISPRSPSKIPQRIGQDSKTKSDTSVGSDFGDRSLDPSLGKEVNINNKTEFNQTPKMKSTFGDDDSELLAELGLLKESNKKPPKSNGWTNSEGKKKTNENENNGRLGLGSLKDAPPLPGISSKKEDAHLDMNSSGDWKDLAAIEEKINKLGFDLPKDDEYGYEDDFVPSSSRKSEEGLSITEEIEEDISIGSFAGSKGDDYFTTDQTVSQISGTGFDYREDIEL